MKSKRSSKDKIGQTTVAARKLFEFSKKIRTRFENRLSNLTKPR